MTNKFFLLLLLSTARVLLTTLPIYANSLLSSQGFVDPYAHR